MTEDVKITMSATVGALAAALAKAQLAMRPALKDAENPAYKSGGRVSRYASLASCIDAMRPLHENGIAVIQPPALHGSDGVCVATLLIHSSGEWIRGELYMPASKKDAQGFGSALSYARRYCLCSTTGLGTDDDDGEQAVRPSPARKVESSEPSALEIELAGAFGAAKSADEIAAIEARAAKAISEKKIVNGGRERLLRERSKALGRLEAR